MKHLIISLLALLPSMSMTQNLLLDVEGNGHIRDRLGIGVTSPQTNLHIGAGHSGGITIQQLAGNAQQLNWRNKDGDLSAAIVHNQPVSGPTDLQFYINNANRLMLEADGDLWLGGFGSAVTQDVSLRVNGGFSLGKDFNAIDPPTDGAIIEGQLGIGVSDPVGQLHIRTDGSDEMIYQSTSTGYVGYTSVNTLGSYFSGTILDRFSIFDNQRGERLTVSANGNIGIGISSPLEKFHIHNGKALITPESTGNTELTLAENSAGSTGSIIRHDINHGLDFFSKEDGTISNTPMLNLQPSGAVVRGNTIGTALEVINASPAFNSNGISVNLNVDVLTPQNRFMIFSHKNKTRGMIHGQETLTTLSRSLINDLLGSDPIEDDPTTASEDRDQAASGSDNGILSFIGSNYGQELLWHTAEFIEAIIVLIANSFSVLDPDDYAACSYAVISQGVKLWVFLAIEELTAGIAYESEGADYAEWLKKADTLEVLTPGDVVGVIGGQISRSYTDADQFMVVSHQPMVVGNMPASDKENQFEKIAFIGQVPVKTIGEVQVGDYILPSGNGDGLAIAVSRKHMRPGDYHRIIGIAWSAADSTKFINLINTAVGINSNDLAGHVEQMQSMMNKMQLALNRLDPNYQVSLFDVHGLENENTFHQNISKGETFSNYVRNQSTSSISEIENLQAYRNKTYGDIKENLTRQGFDFTYFPHLENLLDNPTRENMELAHNHYMNALERMNGLLTNIH